MPSQFFATARGTKGSELYQGRVAYLEAKGQVGLFVVTDDLEEAPAATPELPQKPYTTPA